VLATLGHFTVNFVVELSQAVRRGHHGLALFNSERQVMWAKANEEIELEPGVHMFTHSFPYLPLKPGVYQWQVSLWDDGKMLDLWDCLPEMNIATKVHQHNYDAWNGVLNIQESFRTTKIERIDA
jgi:hypothetical protein